ncbi:MAG: acyltransferase family protein, partial [Planctomycetota bacterium]
RKGSWGYFVARLKRLGIPFVLASLFISPLTYWPSHLLLVPEPEAPYLTIFFTRWPNGVLWFLWVLLVFDGIVALANRLAPSVFAKLRWRPTGSVVLLVTVASCLPFCWVVPGLHWVSLGPFGLEPARMGLYFVYFLLGMTLGAGRGWRHTVWPKRWGLWLALGFASFCVYGLLMMEVLGSPGPRVTVVARPSVSQVAMGVAFAVCCAGTCLGLLGAFRRHARRRHPVLDSLSANSFGIYVFHYLFVAWIQFALLPVPLPALAKFGIASAGGLALSWGTSILVRRIPAACRGLCRRVRSWGLSCGSPSDAGGVGQSTSNAFSGEGRDGSAAGHDHTVKEGSGHAVHA